MYTYYNTLSLHDALPICLANNFAQLVLARGGVGVGEAVGLPSTHSVISDYFPREKRATAMSVLFLAPPLGILIGAGGGALIAQHYGWRVALLSAAAPGLILALLLSLFISEPKRGAHDAVGDSEDVPSIWVVIGRCLSWPTIRNMLFGR